MENKEKSLKKHPIWLYVGLGVVAVIVIVIGVSQSSQKTSQPYCGDGMCNTDENKCSCQSDCGSCYETKGCSQYSCDTNNRCVAETSLPNCCGNGKCEVKENSNSCSQDCGANQIITSAYDAISRVASREDIKKDWENIAKTNNCGSRYLDINNAAYFVARVTVSQNIIECNKYSHFSDMMRALNTSSSNEKYNNYLTDCSKNLIDIFNKGLKGYKENYNNFAISEPCFECNDFYAISLGCINADVDVSTMNGYENSGCESGLCIINQGSSRAPTGYVAVDTKTGAVYW